MKLVRAVVKSTNNVVRGEIVVEVMHVWQALHELMGMGLIPDEDFIIEVRSESAK
jgi:hypothetical protein